MKKKEYSAGGVVWKKTGDVVEWLIGIHSGYHKWVLPKGLIEMGETPKEAAVREVKEETGVMAEIILSDPIHVEEYEYQADFSETAFSAGGVERRVMSYQEGGGKQTWVEKEVKFFLMRYLSGEVEDHSFEMSDVVWVSAEVATERLSFSGEREALRKAVAGVQ